MSAPSILVIDDEPDNFDVIEALLSDLSYELHYASSGQDAIGSLDTFQPDLLLLDVMMPGMDGIEVCRRIKAMPQWQPVPIIMVTALTAKEDLARCLKTGADDFLSKPVNGLELRARVHSMLRIKKQYDDLQTLLKLREDMVQMVVHDLRNPLTNVLFGLELLENLNISPERQKDKIARLRVSGHHLQSLIDDLLLFAKIESGKLQLNRSDIDLCHLIPSVIAGFEEILNQRKIELVSYLPTSSSIISVDIPMFRRVLDNLLSNAIKFSPSHSKVVISADFSPSVGTKIQVADHGAGISDEVQQRIFEKYEIGTLVQDVSQLGLGLAFCKLVIETHHGSIGVRNNQPRGAIFEILLPH